MLAVFGASSLVLFLLVTVVILSFYGGGFATIPAYLKDMFGVAQVGAIHGRLLTAWSCAGVAGPLIINAIADYQIAAGRTGADLYTLSLYIMVGVLAVGFVANLLLSGPLTRGSTWSPDGKRSTRRSPPPPARPPAANRRRNAMSEEARQESGGQTSSSSIVLVIVLWALVLIPLAWGVYQTLIGVVALFTGG